MIRHIASCPYCRVGEISYDYQDMEMIFNPDTVRQQPCEHLVCIQGIYCRMENLPDGGRRAGMAKLDWQRPDFLGTVPDELRRKAVQANAAGPEPLPDQPPCRVEELRVVEEYHLSAEDKIRYLDQVGWENVSEDDLPSQEHRVLGWILFARRALDLLPALVASPAP